MSNCIVIRDGLYNAKQEVIELERLLKKAYKRLRDEEYKNGVITLRVSWYEWLMNWGLFNVRYNLKYYWNKYWE